MRRQRSLASCLVVAGLLAIAGCGSGGTVTADLGGPGLDTEQPPEDGVDDGVLPDGVLPDGTVPPDTVTPDLCTDCPAEDTIDTTEADETEACRGPGEFMCECDDNGDCLSGYCVEWGNGKVCTQPCIEDCPNGWQCMQDVQSLPDVKYICLPEFQFLCTPCTSDDQCKSLFASSKDRCVDFDG
ncbi:MAG: hypothetical protein FJ098_13265, partial [Deltaproteobacteria bacterium]|nr:hypothetical protein [Deltaproteobacteria bacterium]